MLPSARLLGAVALCLVSAVVCTVTVLSPPWLGMTFEHTSAGATLQLANVELAERTPGAPQAGDSLMALAASGGNTTWMDAGDLLEEPDFLDTWAQEDAFYGRQTALTDILHSPAVFVTLKDKSNTVRTVTVTPRKRPLSSLPLVYWLQLCFGAAGLIIGAWVWALRPEEWGTRVYALSGVCFLIFAHAAAVYSARELALPGPLFRALSGINHFGAIHFGATLCALFLVYPLRLVSSRVPLAIGAIAFAWWLACVTRVAPDQDWGSRFPVMLGMLGAIGLAGWQWRRTKGDPAARAVLRWFAISVLVGCGSFIGLIAVASSIGGLPPIPQGYAFGFFLLMYAGLAVGLRQFRVFDLDQWAYRILFWGIAVAAFIVIDLLLLGSVSSGATRTLTLTTVLILASLPLRRWVWSRLLERKQLEPEAMFDKALHVTYAASDTERDARWRALIAELFDPLHFATDGTRDPGTGDDVELVAQGQELAIPAVASSPALRLTYADGGKRLFTPRDAQLARTLVTLMRSANESRKAYDIGVARERTRIARDLHDTVSSPLLAGLAPLGGDENGAQMAAMQNEIRRAVKGMRSVVSGELASSAPLSDCIADARFAAVERLTAAGLTVHWPIADVGDHVLAPAERHAFSAFVQESITNVLRHAQASAVRVQITADADALHCAIADDGRGYSPPATRTEGGNGVPNLHERAAAMGGEASIGARRDGLAGTEVTLRIPLIAVATRAAAS